ncbi:MAG: NADH-quinone oxidoreductase subunit N [Bryobacteraceae bacterium]
MLISILPLLVLSGAAIAAMLAIAVHRSHSGTAAIAMLGLAAAFASLWTAGAMGTQQVTALLVVDFYALFYQGLIIAAAFAVSVLAYGYMERHDVDRDELYVLLLIATLGSAVLASASHFVSFFLGLELLSVSLYAMIAYLHTQERPVEAGIKYLVLAAASAAFLLFGVALLYAELGTMQFSEVAARLSGGAGGRALVAPALALIVAGIGFKLAVVPFHMWTPDVYEGAPAPVTAFVATVSKGAMVALLLRYFNGTESHAAVFAVFTIVALASMIAGNVLALLQRNVKRLLAYSSIAHLGYILAAFQSRNSRAVTFYVVAYFVTTLGAFGVVSAVSPAGREAAEIEDYRGLFWRRPWLAGVFTAMLFSLAGIPLTAGFLAKFYVVAAGAAAAQWGLILTLAVTSGIGVYYYLRVIVALYMQPEGAPELAATPASSGMLLAALTVLLIWFGVYPGPVLDLIQNTVTL